ncbi:MAG: hypothetical protein U9N07_07555 [Euryarchaeota archaeon]|nr:hypothetical protein [Euryarchaeota archaeon]
MNDGGISDLNLTLDEFYLNLVDFPMYQANASACPCTGDKEHKMCGPATGQMNLNYMWWNSSLDPAPPITYNQSYLYDYGIAHNWNTSLPYFDTYGMWRTIQYLDPSPYSVYGYNFNKYSSTDQMHMMKLICHWICYTVGTTWGGHKDGHPYHVPGAVPAYGNYTNWMSVRGVHTNENAYPWPTGELLVYGFWVNDPYPASMGGIGENSYKTADEWATTYYLPLDVSDINPGDPYNGRYVGILEPPDEEVGELRIMPAKPRLVDAIMPVLAEKPLMVYGIEQLALEKVIKDDEMLRIVAAAIDGVNEELIPYDAEFAAAFAKTTAGEPMLVAADGGNYYLVPFNVPVIEKPIKIMPVEIEKAKTSDLKELERVKRVDDRAVIKPIPIEPIKVEKTLVVVLVDAGDGSFKEASWVADPVKYLPVSKTEALKLALGEIDIADSNELKALGSKPTIELVYRDASPYYPDWKITVDGKVFYVSQGGVVDS